MRVRSQKEGSVVSNNRSAIYYYTASLSYWASRSWWLAEIPSAVNTFNRYAVNKQPQTEAAALSGCSEGELGRFYTLQKVHEP